MKNMMEVALDMVSEAVIFVDQNGRISFINRAAAGFFRERQMPQFFHERWMLGENAEIIFGIGTWARMRREETVEIELDRLSCQTKEAVDGWTVSISDESYLYDVTGVYTRKVLMTEVERLDRNQKNLPMSVIFLDVDGLKAVNDSCGHIAGDEILKNVAKAIQEAVRPRDLVARYGGDEFVIVLPRRTNREAAINIAARIRTKVAAYGISVSIGTATINAENSFTFLDAIQAADQNMYIEKAAKKAAEKQ